MSRAPELPQPGDTFAGRYVIEESLGEGGFGLVLRARAIDSNRGVALKILKPSPNGYDLNEVTRFLREMRAIAKLQCPHTLTLYDYGRAHDLIYMVTEFVAGEDLSDLIARRGKLEEREVVHIVYQVLQSLAEAHDAGVLHRDIKPANIRVFEYDANPLMVKVLDFGLAQSLDRAQSRLTATGRVIGTPRYMAPERISDGPLGPPSDIYSLGIVAIEALLGSAAIVRGFGEPVSMGDDAAPVTPALRAIVNRMVDVDPAARYQRASEVLAQLRSMRPSAAFDAVAVARTEPLVFAKAAPTAVETPSPSPTRRDWLRFALPIAGGLMFVVAALVTLTRAEPEPPAPRVPAALQRSGPPSFVSTPTLEPIVPDAGTASTSAPGCGVADPPSGLQTETWYDGVTPRKWAHYAPDGYDASKTYPILLLVADAEAEPSELVDHLDLRKAARIANAIVVAVGVASDGPRIVQKVLDLLAQRYCVDRRRVLVMGQAEMDRVVRDLTCSDVVSARMYRPSTSYGRDETCWDGRVVPTIAFVGFTMTDESAPVDEHALKAHGCASEPEVSDTLPRLRCHAAECETLLVACRQSGHVHHEPALIEKYGDALFAGTSQEVAGE